MLEGMRAERETGPQDREPRPRREGRVRRLLPKLALSAVTCLLCLLVLEVALRLTGYGAVGHREGNVVLHVTEEFRHRVVLNDLDLREAPIPPKAPGEIRLMAIGDSFTYGIGVEDSETFARLLEGRLDERLASAGIAARLRLLNCGLGGGPYRQGEWLEDVGLGLEPDLVLQSFYIGNDIYDDIAWRDGTAPAQGGPTGGKGVRGSLRHSVALDWMWGRLVQVPLMDRLLFRLGMRRSERGLFLVDEPDVEREAWAATLDKLGEIHRSLERHGIDYRVMIIPSAVQIRFSADRSAARNYRKPNQVLGQYLDRSGIEHLDLLPQIEALPDSDALYYRRDLHWTPRGHAFAAEQLAAWLWPEVERLARGAAESSGP